MRHRLRYRVLLLVGIAATLGQIATATFYSLYQERTVLAQNELAMRKLTYSVAQGLQSVMLAGSADIAQVYADRLKQVPEVREFRIMRKDGTEAFRDNKTILEVNRRRGEDVFLPREKEESIVVMDRADPAFQKVLGQKAPVSVDTTDDKGNRILTFLAPVLNLDVCHKCHGSAEPIRGVMRLTTSLAAVERDILRARQQSLLVLVLSLTGTLLLTGYMFGRTVVRPIEKVTRAMARISNGDLDHRVAITTNDEIGRMAMNFNRMTEELKQTYHGLRLEQDKLTTVIESASEGMVVTDAAGVVVMANTAAARLLGKNLGEIVAGGFFGMIDDPELIRRCVESSSPITVEYKERVLRIHVSVSHRADDHLPGFLARIRDISAEHKLEADLRHLATTDALTGVFNRRFLDATLDTEFHRVRRSHDAISVIIFDVDHFKNFNDTYGHDQGDRVLQTVARCLRETLRSFDFPCRYGGEEFVAVLPGMDSATAQKLAERLRQTVAATAVDGLFVQISLGVASFPGLAVESGAALLEAADGALYEAKKNGRNRVMVAKAAS